MLTREKSQDYAALATSYLVKPHIAIRIKSKYDKKFLL